MQSATPAGERVTETNADQEQWVEDVASRLGLPVGMLIRRIEAGTLPATAVPSPDGVRYRLRPGPQEHGEPPVTTPAASPAGLEESGGIDSGTLVAGLLDRWERTMEQRLRAESRFDEVAVQAGLQALRAEMEEVRARLDAARAAAEARERVVTAQASELAVLRPTAPRLAELERIAASLRKDMAERDRALADLHTQLTRRDEEIDRLRQQQQAGRKQGLRRRH